MEKETFRKLTLEDIENMVKILEHFVRVSRRVENLLRKVTPTLRGSYGFNPSNIMETILQMSLQRTGQKVEEIPEEEEVSEEELKSIEKTLEKIKSKKIKEIT